jgi:hypothetical protein
MNWRKGLWRAWAAVSGLWLALILVVQLTSPRMENVYPAANGGVTTKPWEMAWDKPAQDRCSKAREKTPSLGNVFSCFEPNQPDGPMVTDWATTAEVAAEAGLIPPALLLLLGLICVWVLRGFKRAAS